MIEIVSDKERVLVSLKHETISLTSREAFSLVTDLLREIDCARGYGEAIRGEVTDPRWVRSNDRAKKARAARKKDPGGS